MTIPHWIFLVGWIAAAVVAGLAVLIGGMLVWIRLVAKPSPPLPKDLVGATGVALTDISAREGKASVGGRVMIAISEAPIAAGKPVRVEEVAGLVAKVALDTSAKA